MKTVLTDGGRVEASLASKHYKAGRKYKEYLDGDKMYECIVKLLDLRTDSSKVLPP